MHFFLRRASAKAFNLFKKVLYIISSLLHTRKVIRERDRSAAISIPITYAASTNKTLPISRDHADDSAFLRENKGPLNRNRSESAEESMPKFILSRYYRLNGPFRFCEIRSHQIWIPIYRGSSNVK